MSDKEQPTTPGKECKKAEDVMEVFQLIASKGLTMADVVKGGLAGAVYHAAEEERKNGTNGPVAAAYDSAMKNGLTFGKQGGKHSRCGIGQANVLRGLKRNFSEAMPYAKPSDVYRAAVQKDVDASFVTPQRDESGEQPAAEASNDVTMGERWRLLERAHTAC